MTAPQIKGCGVFAKAACSDERIKQLSAATLELYHSTMSLPAPIAQLARSTAVHVAFAFFAMGAWAAFANHTHGWMRALIAALVQGTLSGAITFGLKRSLEAMAARLTGPAALIVPPLVTCVVVLAVLLGAHRLAGTPEVWATIAVPYAVSSSYAWIYAAGLFFARSRAAA